MQLLRRLFPAKKPKALEFDKHKDFLLTKANGSSGLLQHSVQQIYKQGYTIIRNCVDENTIDQTLKEFDQFKASKEVDPKFINEHGLHSRLCNLHMESEGARKIAFAPKVTEVLDFLFQSEAAVFTSLFFERGSNQELHRDCPFFVTSPRNLFFGVWTALEDISPDSGPLTYVPESHFFSIDDVEDYYEAHKSEKDPLEASFTTYKQKIYKEVEQLSSKRIPALINKGDTVIWHPLLVHGGSDIKDPSRSRKSIVFHYAPKGYTMTGIDVFFGKEKFPHGTVHELAQFEGRSYLKHGPAFFAMNY